MVSISEAKLNTFGEELRQRTLEYHLFEYLKPPVSFDEELHLAEIAMSLDRYNTGLIVGRFQPLHYGHILLMKVAARICNEVVIGIGSANIIDKDNPFTVGERERWLRQQLNRFGLTPQVSRIVRLDDFHDNERWGNETLEAVGHIDAVIGNNDSVNDIFKDKAGITIVETPLFIRNVYQGTEIRPKLRELRLIRS